MDGKESYQHNDKFGDTTLAAALLLLTSLAPLSADAATIITTVNVNVVSNISLTTTGGLLFGDISSSGTAGTVIMTATGSRSSTGGVTINSAVAGSPATFNVEGEANASYSISLPASVVLSDPASHTMVVDNFTSSPTPSGVLDDSGKQTIFVGATLNVSSNQAFGAYSGQMAVTVDYN